MEARLNHGSSLPTTQRHIFAWLPIWRRNDAFLVFTIKLLVIWWHTGRHGDMRIQNVVHNNKSWLIWRPLRVVMERTVEHPSVDLCVLTTCFSDSQWLRSQTISIAQKTQIDILGGRECGIQVQARIVLSVTQCLSGMAFGGQSRAIQERNALDYHQSTIYVASGIAKIVIISCRMPCYDILWIGCISCRDNKITRRILCFCSCLSSLAVL